MPKVSAVLIVPAILGAAAAGYFLADHRSATAATPPSSLSDAPGNAGGAAAASQKLPSNHPAVGTAPQRNPHGGALPNAENQQPPALEWKVPAGWQAAENPNPMRLATYKTSDGVEVSVSRAGGPADANILRWSQQFEGAPQPQRTEKDIRGVHVTTVRIAGTYEGGMGATEPEKHAGWAMLAAIADAPGAHYFFKVVGPEGQVDANRASFDALLVSIAPHAAP